MGLHRSVQGTYGTGILIVRVSVPSIYLEVTIVCRNIHFWGDLGLKCILHVLNLVICMQII